MPSQRKKTLRPKAIRAINEAEKQLLARAPHARPEAMRLASRLRAVSDRLMEISGDEPEGRGWL